MTTNQQDIITRYGRDFPYTRKTGDQSIVDGVAYRSDNQSTTIFGNLQPLSFRELQHLPEGERSRDWRNFWSLVEVFEGDVIVDDQIGQGVTYVVQEVQFWPLYDGSGDFYASKLMRREGKVPNEQVFT